MHSMIFVIGDDPLGQLTGPTDAGETVYLDPAEPDAIRWTWERTESEALRTLGNGDCGGTDWYGIGGRYSGFLIPEPGAQGKRYGDTMPAIEAWLSTYLPGGTAPLPARLPGRPARRRPDPSR